MRYNRHKQKYIVLKEGEYFCKKCNGSGDVPRSNATHRKNLICSKCLGEGKLDWIEKAVGKRIPVINLKMETVILKERERKLKGKWTIENL